MKNLMIATLMLALSACVTMSPLEQRDAFRAALITWEGTPIGEYLDDASPPSSVRDIGGAYTFYEWTWSNSGTVNLPATTNCTAYTNSVQCTSRGNSYSYSYRCDWGFRVNAEGIIYAAVVSGNRCAGDNTEFTKKESL